MFEVHDITDFDIYNFVDDICNITLRMHTCYEYPNIYAYHTFINEKVMLESVKKYNQIQSIRQHTNLNMASQSGDLADLSFGFNNIHSSFIDTKKSCNRSIVSSNVHFMHTIKRMFYNYTLRFIDGTCIYNPVFDVYYDAPIVDSSYNFSCNEFIRFISFMKIYSTQSLMVVVNHNRYNNIREKIIKYDYIFDIKLNAINSKDRRISVSPFCDVDRILSFDVNRLYKKFFDG